MGNILTGKKIVVMGVANKRSIAWGCAQMMAEQGAQIIYCKYCNLNLFWL